MQNKTSPILEVKELELTFSGDFGNTRYLQDVSFELYPGEVLGIVGESGSGKSITSLAIMGLLANNGKVTHGEILYRGQDLTKLSEDEMDEIRGKHISMIFQDAITGLNPVFTIGNQIREAVRAHSKMSKGEAEQKAVELLERVGLPRAKGLLKRYPHTLSGGMRQRVMIAMAIASNPEIMIADEPTTALDVTVQAQIMALLKSLAEERQTSIILITHDIGLIAQMADRILVMYAGQIVEEAPLRMIFEYPGHPYTMALQRSVPSITDDADRKLRSIPGVVPPNYSEITGCRFYDRCEFAQESCRENVQKMLTLREGQKVRCERATRGDFKDMERLLDDV